MGGILAVLLKVGPFVLSLLPHIPDIVNAVHQVAGPTQGNGTNKLEAAVTLATSVVPELEDAFNASLSVRSIVSGFISLAYDILKEQGKITGIVDPTSVVASAVAAAPLQPFKAAPQDLSGV